MKRYNKLRKLESELTSFNFYYLEKRGQPLLDIEISYLDNCIFWLKEFQEGRTDKKRVQSVVLSINLLVAEIGNKINKK